RGTGHSRRTHRAGAARPRRFRLRPDLLLSTVRRDARRGRRPQGGGEPPGRGISKAAHVSAVPILNDPGPTAGRSPADRAEMFQKPGTHLAPTLPAIAGNAKNAKSAKNLELLTQNPEPTNENQNLELRTPNREPER